LANLAEVETMTTTDPKYLVDGLGRKKAVLLNIGEYSRLLKRVEELEDALDLDKAVCGPHEFMDYSKIREGLVKEGKL
jgi:hypothetical protein